MQILTAFAPLKKWLYLNLFIIISPLLTIPIAIITRQKVKKFCQQYQHSQLCELLGKFSQRCLWICIGVSLVGIVSMVTEQETFFLVYVLLNIIAVIEIIYRIVKIHQHTKGLQNVVRNNG